MSNGKKEKKYKKNDSLDNFLTILFFITIGFAWYN